MIKWKPCSWVTMGSIWVVLSACGGNMQPQAKQEPMELQQRQLEAVRAKREARLKLAFKRDQRIERLSAQAEAALLKGRLTLPENDNAYDRFSAVLMMDANNEYAKNGLSRILLAYVARVHQSLSGGQIQRAKSMVDRAKIYFPNDPLVLGLLGKLREAEKEAVIELSPLSIQQDATVSLPRKALTKKSSEVESILVQVAKRVELSDEAVLIYARSDAEGRWIYKTMKKAVSDYRIRGDIRIHTKPAIVFMEPLDEDKSVSE